MCTIKYAAQRKASLRPKFLYCTRTIDIDDKANVYLARCLVVLKVYAFEDSGRLEQNHFQFERLTTQTFIVQLLQGPNDPTVIGPLLGQAEIKG